MIGFSETALETRFKYIRIGETNLTNFYADLIKAQFETEIAVYNSGTIRADELFEPGPITYKML